MTNAQTEAGDDAAVRLIDSVQDVEHSALEAVRTFLDEVNSVFPEVGQEGARRKIIDSAFNMTEHLVGASNDLARRIVRVTEDALGEDATRTSSSNR